MDDDGLDWSNFSSHPDVKGDASSQPLTGEAIQVLNKPRRLITGPDPGAQRDDGFTRFIDDVPIAQLPDTNFETIEKFRTAVFRVLRARLKANGIVSHHFKEQLFPWCLPKDLSQIDTWKLLLSDPLLVSNNMLAGILRFEPSTPQTPLPNLSSTATFFYIRTYTLKAQELLRVFDAMLHDGYDSNKWVFLWMEHLADPQVPLDTRFTLRYCGQSIHRPWDRHVSDTYHMSLSNFHSRFLGTIGMLYPSALTNAVVDVVSDVSTDVKLAKDILDLREQVLIALFGYGVLNTESGGKDVCVLSEEDMRIFHTLGTHAIKSMKQTGPPSLPVLEGLREYAKQVHQYVATNPSTTGGKGKRFFSEATEDMLVKQGTPQVLSDGSAVMVTLGSDIGDTHEHDDETFFEGDDGRSANTVAMIYNNLGHWELPFGQPFDGGLTKQLAREGALPFVDLFPWFVKHDDEYKAACNLTAQYMNTVRPMIVLAYGQKYVSPPAPLYIIYANLSNLLQPSYAAMQNFKEFTRQNYQADQKFQQRANGPGHWVREVIGVPQLVSFNGEQGTAAEKECVLIPCHHPGHSSHVGIMRQKVNRLLAMVSGLVFCAMSYSVDLDKHKLHKLLSRKEKCDKIIEFLHSKLDQSHEFGRAFTIAKSEYMLAATAWHQGRVTRQSVGTLPKPPRGILQQKERVRRTQVDPNARTIESSSDGFEVTIVAKEYNGFPRFDKVRHSLTWVEDGANGTDFKEWCIEPVFLPANVIPTNSNEKRFLHFTVGGIDIRNSVGVSVGDRKPLITGTGRSETISLASLVVSLSNSDATQFFKQWERITGELVDEVLCGRFTSTVALENSLEEHYPASFFEASPTHRSLIFTGSVVKPPSFRQFVELIENDLPANPGDLIWLMDRFFQEALPSSRQVDLLAGSLTNDSVYRIIARFCAQAKYKHHPHLRTFMALASLPDMGLDDRVISANAMTMAVEILYESFTKKNKTATIYVNDIKQTAGRYVLTLGARKDDDANIIRNVREPKLVRDIVVVSDVTDDEEEEYDGGSVAMRKKRARQDLGEEEKDEYGGIGRAAGKKRARQEPGKSGSKAARVETVDMEDDDADVDDETEEDSMPVVAGRKRDLAGGGSAKAVGKRPKVMDDDEDSDENLFEKYNF